MNKNSTRNQGFTLLELLIVIAIIAILSVILVLVLDPAETLKKSRDSQRMSDLSTLKTALGLYTTGTTTPAMATTVANCWDGGSKKVFYSIDTASKSISAATLNGVAATAGQVATADLLGKVDGTGWLPVNLASLSSGSPISNLPIDPINTVTTAATPTSTDLVYRYVCNNATKKYEIDARLESTAYTVDDNKMSKDGGNNVNYYEVGTDLTLLGATTDY